MNHVYDAWKRNPFLIERLENTIRNKIARGGSFNLHPVHILEIPDRAVLRANMEERYGISAIDEYFIPVVVDTNTYRKLRGEEEPSIFDGWEEYSGKIDCLRGHVKKVNDYFISYISANLPLDAAIEHEGIHAFMFKHNPHYAGCAPTLGFASAAPSSAKVGSWIEAVPWVATNEEVDVDEVFDRYVNVPDTPRTLLSIGVDVSSVLLACAVLAGYESVQTFKEGKPLNAPYKIIGSGLELVHGLHAAVQDKDVALNHWRESFQLAADLKEKLGVKEFIRLAGSKHQDELGDLL